MDQQKFIETVEKIKNKANENKQMISVVTVKEMLSSEGMELTGEQLKMVYAFLKTSKITLIDDDDWYDDESATGEEGLTSDDIIDNKTETVDERDAEFVQMYLDDISAVPVLNDEQIIEVIGKIVSKQRSNEDYKDLKEKLINTFLKNVVSWLKNYDDTAVLMSDLIQEGNMALMEIINSLNYEEIIEANNPIRKFKDTVKKSVLKAAQDSIYLQESENNVGYKVEGRVNAVNECAKKLSEEYGMKVSISQVAKEMEMDEDEVREIVELSANKIEYIDVTID